MPHSGYSDDDVDAVYSILDFEISNGWNAGRKCVLGTKETSMLQLGLKRTMTILPSSVCIEEVVRGAQEYSGCYIGVAFMA